MGAKMTGYAKKSKYVHYERAIALIAKHHFEGALKKARDDTRDAERDGELRIGWRDLKPGEAGYGGGPNKTMYKPNFLRVDLERIYGEIFVENPKSSEMGVEGLSADATDNMSNSTPVWSGDDVLLEEMQNILTRRGTISSIHAASLELVEKATGNGTVENKAKRLARKYSKSDRYNPNQPKKT
jgi:hypothetical protein